jgi:hypothetical protein
LAKTTFGEKYEVSINAPFIGTYVPLTFYSKDQRVQSIMLELRKDAYGSGEIVDSKLRNMAVRLAAFSEGIARLELPG